MIKSSPKTSQNRQSPLKRKSNSNKKISNSPKSNSSKRSTSPKRNSMSCKTNEIYNPDTHKCVQIDSKIGQMLKNHNSKKLIYVNLLFIPMLVVPNTKLLPISVHSKTLLHYYNKFVTHKINSSSQPKFTQAAQNLIRVQYSYNSKHSNDPYLKKILQPSQKINFNGHSYKVVGAKSLYKQR